MWLDLEDDLAAGQTTTLAVNEERWRVQMVTVTRMASDWFVQFAVMGPRAHTIFLRSDAPPSERRVSRRLLARVREWLRRNESRACAFLDANGKF